MKPKVSIGISFMNPGKYFELALKSVFSQTFPDWELILVDDGSSDDSLTLAKSLKDARVRVYCDGQNKKLNARLNELVERAEAPYFVRMDADDIMHPERVERQYRVLTQHNLNTVVGTAAYSIDADSHVVGFRASRPKPQLGFGAQYVFIHPTVAAARDWFRQNPYSLDPIYYRSEDAELWCRTTTSTEFVNLPEPLLYYREVNTFSMKNYLGTSLGLLSILLEEFSRPRSKFAYLFTRELAKLWIVTMINCLGLTHWLVARRYRPLSPTELQRANQALEFVRQQPLPV